MFVSWCEKNVYGKVNAEDEDEEGKSKRIMSCLFIKFSFSLAVSLFLFPKISIFRSVFNFNPISNNVFCLHDVRSAQTICLKKKKTEFIMISFYLDR